MNLTDEVKEFLYAQGADLVGVGRAENLMSAPQGHRPNDYLPTARSFVSFAYSLNRAALLNLPKSRNEYLLEFDYVNTKLDNLAYKTARFLESKEFLSMAVPAPGSIGDLNRLMGDISQKHAAVVAGLGLTEAELTPDQPITKYQLDSTNH